MEKTDSLQQTPTVYEKHRQVTASTGSLRQISAVYRKTSAVYGKTPAVYGKTSAVYSKTRVV